MPTEGPKALYIAGSTGSIGTQALDVVRASPGRFDVVALSAARSVTVLAEQAREFGPRFVAVADPSKAGELSALVPAGTSAESSPALEGSATATKRGPNSLACSASTVTDLAALRATTSNRPGEARTTSRAWVPIEPVLPAM